MELVGASRVGDDDDQRFDFERLLSRLTSEKETNAICIAKGIKERGKEHYIRYMTAHRRKIEENRDLVLFLRRELYR